ncbi:hypothetical protein PGUG_00344 [Meyerozyma guilliermondii ATCC 6260]|uniref:RING-type domain-containing protein n=1 Tax=Meyerozyma guilliermondii (strain ATCC 6260 / CBS 566 / DSM 6381 / JCM 1539 / NBRC 10279 / NRRL Y-324) TaxID=294746 RepID=A5DAN9_PICGU|nr:uncharacterized protein PGUG_00344 [Meyerozyma guilliermondii ATCC 6260]EDK36246.2 hypothetical protein PGUG_00344 [Meyerozyma guilliermondii ATCC 6260]
MSNAASCRSMRACSLLRILLHLKHSPTSPYKTSDMLGNTFCRRLAYEIDFSKSESLAKFQTRFHGLNLSFYHLCFLGFLLIVNCVKWGMFGRLTRNEVKHLKDRVFYTGWEFSFGFILFFVNTKRDMADIKNELFKFSGLFLCVLLLKCFHFLSADRVNTVFGNLNGNFRWAHHRFGMGILLIGFIDILLISRFFKEVDNFRSMHKSSFGDNILAAIFGFEIINMFPLIVLTGVKYTCTLYRQNHYSKTSRMNQAVHVAEFLVNLSRFLIVCIFSVVFLYFYTFPFHIMPSSYMSLRVLVTKTRHLIMLHRKRTRLLKLKSAPPNGDCSICFDTLDNECRTTTCKHSFHLQCLHEWANYAETCPVCRSVL